MTRRIFAPRSTGGRSIAPRWKQRPTVLLLACAAIAGCSDAAEPPTAAPRAGADVRVSSLTTHAVSVPFCDARAPLWVAFQDGDGPWTRVMPRAAGGNEIFHYVFHSDRGAIAYALPLPIEDDFERATLLDVRYGAPGELVSVGQVDPFECRAVTAERWNGTVAGLEANQSVLVSAGLFSQATAAAAKTDFTLEGIPAGPEDLLASLSTPTAGGSTLTRVILRRDLDLADGGALAPLDFASNEAFAPATPRLTVAGIDVQDAVQQVELHTANGAMVLDSRVEDPSATVRTYDALPESRLRHGDLQSLMLSTDDPGNGGRAVQLFFRTPGDRTLTFGAALVRPEVSLAATTPSPRPRASFEPQADYDRLTSILFDQTANPTVVRVSMTAAYAARSGGGYELTVPDLSTVDGFDPTWSLVPGRTVAWTAFRSGGNAPLGSEAAPTDGTYRIAAQGSGAIAAP